VTLHSSLHRPVVTEKSTVMAEAGKYVFEVADNASKAYIKEAVEAAFGVAVVSVNVMSVHGKMKRYGRRPKPRRSWKKAIVTLREGDKIDLFASA
jgi:large subunit ribosomal protein L23